MAVRVLWEIICEQKLTPDVVPLEAVELVPKGAIPRVTVLAGTGRLGYVID